MASIAYITDQKMIEYHRLNGSTSINFWRPTMKRKISDFEVGDFLFFLSKGTERGRKREKGIIGYGKFQKSQNLSFSQMWNTYGSQNGYTSKVELQDAMRRITKDKKVPKSINCLYLTDVVYFQFPIYLSEFEMQISNKIESYIYLDKDDPTITNKILAKAKEVGIDLWSSTLNDDQITVESIDVDQLNYNLSESYSMVELDIYKGKSNSQLKKLKDKIIEFYQFNQIPIEPLKGSNCTLVSIQNKKVEIITPLIYQQKNMNTNFQAVIGHIILYRSLIIERLKDYQIEFIIALKDTVSLETIALLNATNINYQIYD